MTPSPNAALKMGEPQRRRVEICSVPEGEASFVWPALMTPESASEVVVWLEFLLEKYKKVANGL